MTSGSNNNNNNNNNNSRGTSRQFGHVWEPTFDSLGMFRKHSSFAKCVTIVIGNTKAGKSSLISLFTGSGRKPLISSGTKAATRKVALYESGNILLMDTPGTNDKHFTDKETRRKIFKKLYDKNVQKIKVIWITNSDTTGNGDAFQKQAHFIHSLSEKINNSYNNNIWKSCLIVKKMGVFEPTVSDMQGVIAAAKDYGLVIGNEKTFAKQHLLGYKALQWMKSIPKAVQYCPEHVQKEDGYLTNDQIKRIVISKLNNLSSFTMEYMSEQCSKCNATGDRRYFNGPCHTEPKVFHSGVLVSQHGNSRRGHSGSYERVSNMEIAGMVTVGGLALTACALSGGLLGAAFVSTSAVSAGAAGVAGTVGSAGSIYSCGKLGEHIDKVYMKWSCCKERSKSHRGCKKYCTKCDAQINGNSNSGCITYYNCCRGLEGSNGCKTICKCCDRPWGTEPGCFSE